MKIVYLHGLESNVDQKDPKIIFLNNNFDEVFTPAINYKDKNTFAKLFSKIKAINPDLIVGSSIGGYFAYLIGSKLGIETVLFNPAVIGRAFDPIVDDTNLSGARHNVFLGQSDNVISGKDIKTYFNRKGVGSFKYNSYKGGHRVPEDTFINSIKNTAGIKENDSSQIYTKRKSIKMKHIKSFGHINELKNTQDLYDVVDKKTGKYITDEPMPKSAALRLAAKKKGSEIELSVDGEEVKDKQNRRNESVLNEAVLSLPAFAALMVTTGILGRLGLMSDDKFNKLVGQTKSDVKSIGKIFKRGFLDYASLLPVVGKKMKYKALQNLQKGEVAKYLKDEMSDADIVKILKEDPKLAAMIDGIANGSKNYSDLYTHLKNLGGHKDGRWGEGMIADKFKKLRAKIAKGSLDESVAEGKLNEFTDLEILGFLTKSKVVATKNKLPKLVKNLQKHIKNLEKKIKLSKTIEVNEGEVDPMSSLLQSFEKAMTDKKAYAAIVDELEGAPADMKPKIMQMADEFIPAKSDGVLELIDELENGEIDPEDIGANETKEVLIKQFKEFIKVTEFAIKTIKKHVNESVTEGSEAKKYVTTYRVMGKDYQFVHITNSKSMVKKMLDSAIQGGYQIVKIAEPLKESVNEAKFNKKSLLKAMKKADGVITVDRGIEYIIYNPKKGDDSNIESDSGREGQDFWDMWQDDVIFGVDQDGEEHEINYSDIVSFNESRIDKTSDQDRIYYDFLLTLRDSGKTNMFGAAPYLQREFGLDKREAREVLAKWMKQFNESVTETTMHSKYIRTFESINQSKDTNLD